MHLYRIILFLRAAMSGATKSYGFLLVSKSIRDKRIDLYEVPAMCRVPHPTGDRIPGMRNGVAEDSILERDVQTQAGALKREKSEQVINTEAQNIET